MALVVRGADLGIDAPGCAAVHPSGGLWLGGTGVVVHWRPGEGSTGYRARVADLHDGRVTEVRSGAGAVWLGTPAGVARVTGSGTTWYGPGTGLADPRVTHIVPLGGARESEALIGTWRGLSRFDGRTMAPVAGYDGTVTALLGTDSVAWVGTARGVRSLDLSRAGGRRRPAPVLSIPTGVTFLYLDRKGSLWIGSAAAGLWRSRGGAPARVDLPAERVLCLTEDADGRLWAGTDAALFRREGEAWRPTPVPTAAVTGLRPAVRGVWVATWGQGLWRCEPGGCEPVAGSAGERVWGLDVDEAGRLWTASDGGLFRCAEACEPVEHPELTAALPLGPVAAAGPSIWVGSPGGGGAVRVDGDGAVLRLAPDRRLPEGPVHALAADPRDGSLWIGTGAGLLRFDGRQFVPWSPGGADSAAVLALATGADGTVWVGGAHGLGRVSPDADRRSPTGLEWLETPVPAPVRTLAVDAGERLWAGTAAGLLRRGPAGDTRWYTTADGLPSDSVRDLATGPDGRLWAATSAGLAVRERSGWRVYTTADGLPSNLVWAVHTDRAGGVWIGTLAGGAARFDGRRFVGLNARQGLPSNVVRQVLEDDTGNVWLVTDLGLAAVRLQDLPKRSASLEVSWSGAAAAAALALLAAAAWRAVRRRQAGVRGG